jgi:glycosyltransferase involved in cell wall biosynthesis
MHRLSPFPKFHFGFISTFPSGQATFATPMNIVINTRFMAAGCIADDITFQYEVLKRITSVYAGHNFIFFAGKTDVPAIKFGDNVHIVAISVLQHHSFLSKWWRDMQLDKLLRKYNADIFISCIPVCSLRARIPQVLLTPVLDSHAQSGRLSGNILPYAKKATGIFTTSGFFKRRMVSDLDLAPEKIAVVRAAAIESFHPLDENSKESVRNNYTAGKNYFIYIGPTGPYNGHISLLKAFSIFKKRQKSDWKLLFVGTGDGYGNLEKSLATYKHREDVVLLKDADDQQLAELTAAAYAFINPTPLDITSISAFNAMRCGAPVVACESSAIAEIAGDSILCINPGDHQDIADKIMLLYKDEALWSRLRAKAMEIEKQWTWEKAANQIWESIMQHSGIISER